MWAILASPAVGSESDSQTITNLHGLKRAVETHQRSLAALDLEVVVCAADPEKGLLTLQDDTGVEACELDLNGRTFHPGERIRIKVDRCELVRRKWCVAVVPAPLVDNGGIGMKNELTGQIYLTAGLHPLRLFYLNATDPAFLEVNYAGPGIPLQPIPSQVLFLEPPPGNPGTNNLQRGLNYMCYEDCPFSISDLRYMSAIRAGTATNFDISLRQPQEFVALQFRGLIEIPHSGEYTFTTISDDGSELYVGALKADLSVIASNAPPAPKSPHQSRPAPAADSGEWATVEGQVIFAGASPYGLEMELKEGNHLMRLWLANQATIPVQLMANARVRATGVCRRIIGGDGVKVTEQVSLIGEKNFQILSLAAEQWLRYPLTTTSNLAVLGSEAAPTVVHLKGTVSGLNADGGFRLNDGTGTISVKPMAQRNLTNASTVEVLGILARSEAGFAMHTAFYRQVGTDTTAPPELTTAAQVQQLSASAAAAAYPVRVRGVITCLVEWGGGVVQDFSRGVFFTFPAYYREGLLVGDFVEISGVTDVGNFAPAIAAETITRLGRGKYPEPVIPNWKQLISGSLDSQYIELRGIITAVEGKQATLLGDGGKIKINIHDTGEATLNQYLNTLVHIRGCLLAEWDAQTRQVKVGEIAIRHPTIEAEQLPMLEPFSAPVKMISDLLLFDLQASGFQRVKVSGQIVCVRGGEHFLIQDGQGLRFQATPETKLQPGDLVDVVGIPDLSGATPQLRETAVRKTGWTNLPAAQSWSEAELSGKNLDGLRLHTEARLIGIHNTGTDWALELQTGLRAYRALVSTPENLADFFPLGSVLNLSGVYAIRDGDGNGGHSAFELLLNSRADIQLIARPPWWTLRRLLLIVAALVAVLTGAAIWIKQLRKLVAQRTALLEREHAKRERAERERALESERARIARDLHDDLGSSLSEIRVLASNGQRLKDTEGRAPSLFLGITEKARNLIAALDVIVWAVDPEANSLQSLADYLAGYTTEYLATSHIICRFKIPVSLPNVSLDGRARHDLFLAVKETLHNVVRHSGATQVEFQLTTTGDSVRIVIIDDGCGFDLEATRAKGHGLKNISERLVSSGGSCSIQSRPGSGTSVCIQLQLPGGARPPQNA